MSFTDEEIKLMFAKPVPTDKDRLDWLCKFITNKGLNGLRKIPWTVYNEDGESLMNRKTISEEDVGGIEFDRAAIDKAMAAERKAT